MLDTKLTRLLSVLTPAEYEAFRAFVAAALVQRSPILENLLAFLLPFYPNFDAERCTLEDAYFALFPNSSPDEGNTPDVGKVRRHFSRLTEVLEGFIHFLHTQQPAANFEQPFERQLALLHFTATRGLHHLYDNAARLLDRDLDAQPLRSSKYYEDRYRFQRLHADYLSAHRDIGTGDVGLQPLADALDDFYRYHQLELAAMMRARQRAAKFEYDLVLMPALTQLIPQNLDPAAAKTATFRAWLLANALADAPTLDAYSELKAILERYRTAFTPREARNLYVFLENAARQVFTDRDDSLRALFALYDTQLERGILFPERTIAPQQLWNLTVVAVAVGHGEWAETLLNETAYTLLPDPDGATDTRELCRAVLAFESRDYERVLELLNTVAPNNIHAKLNERRLRLKAYYELKLEGLLEALVNSFRKFLTDSRDKIPETHLQPHRDFITLAYKLFRTRRGDRHTLAALRSEIDAADVLPELSWIETKWREKA